MNGDPQRLFESSDVPAELRADLERARRDDPAGYDVAAGMAAFEAAIADVPAGVDAADAGTTGAVASKSTTWVLVAALGVVTAGAIAWGVGRLGEDDRVEHAPAIEPAHEDREVGDPIEAAPSPVHASPVAREVDGASAPAVDEAAPAPEADDTPAPEADDAPDARPRTRSKPDPRPRASDPTPDRLAAEMRATKAAEERLRSNPARALALARQADRDFPEGLFGQEREAIVVLALFELGRVDEATAKAKRYLARHPRGSFADKIRAALER